jgi:lipopolysaccharide export system protein LptA
VRADSADSRIHAAWLELHLSEAGGKREILRAVAGGGVTVRQGSRWATAERANYFAAEQKFVLSGGTATMHDALGNTVSGAELTFFLASDTIFVKSEEGSRTLTRYRVER